MSAGIEEYRSRLRDALTTINQLKSKLESITRGQAEPIAIVGMACRFPGGGDTPERFFQALEKGLDAVTEVPANRWALGPITDNPIARATRWGAFLEQVDQFDADFFGISPREAARLDPQQRLLLELSWEAIENAGVVPSLLVGSKTGVFLGMMTNDYALVDASAGRDQQDAYSTTGNMHCFPAGRLSYTLGLQGPSMVVDTACSSSLVALHLACQSLRNRESELALVGGVNLMLSGETTEQFSKTRALSPDGRCKTFDAAANGYVRGEGCGVLLLKRLADAQRDGNPIVALIRGSAVNQDGRSTGLTTPNVLAQQSLVRNALANAGVTPHDIGYIEAHGTGTPLGDPIEIDALRAVFGAQRPDGSTCVIGAVKTNIGHLEAGAGMAGIIKTAMIFSHSLIPKNGNFRNLNPRIDIQDSALVLAARHTPWKRSNKPRRAGISSFGMSGTNAHVILEEAPEETQRGVIEQRSAYLLPISAKSTKAIAHLARAYAEIFARSADPHVQDIVHTVSVRRTHHEYRFAAVARTREEFIKVLESFAADVEPTNILENRAKTHQSPRVVFVFPGQGSQWVGMGRELFLEDSAFRTTMEACDAAISREIGISILEQMTGNPAQSRIDEIDIVQPLLFALEVALAATWQSWGVEPDCVIGHSMGEVAGAHVAGMLSLEDACKVICRRSQLLRSIRGQGAMALVELPFAEAQAAIKGHEATLSIAVENSPRSTVLSGDPAAIEHVLAQLEKAGVYCRRIKVDVASHSPQVEQVQAELVRALRNVVGKPGRFQMRSTVTGKVLNGEELGASYWSDNLRQPVRFSFVTQTLIAEGFDIFVEISPHPILLPSIEENFNAMSRAGAVIASMRRDNGGTRTFLEALSALYHHGYSVNFSKRYADVGQVVPLPPYPWQRERYWIDAPKTRQRIEHVESEHPLLGRGFVPRAQPELHVWEQQFSVQTIPYLADHRVQDNVVFPGAGYVEMAIAAATNVYGEGIARLDDLAFEQILVLTQDESRIFQLSLLEDGGGRGTIQISSKQEGSKHWVRHVAAKVHTVNTSTLHKPVNRKDIESRCPEVISARAHYEQMEALELHYGKCFQGVLQVHLGKGEIMAHVRLPDGAAEAINKYCIHPALMDACFQASVWALQSSMPQGTFVPVNASGVGFHQRAKGDLWVHARLMEMAERPDFTIAMIAYDQDGRAIFEIAELRIRLLDQNQTATTDSFDDCIFGVEWRKTDLLAKHAESPTTPKHWLVLHDHEGVGTKIAAQLRADGGTVVDVWPGHTYAASSHGGYTLNPTHAEHWDKALTSAFGSRGCDGAIHCETIDCAPWRATTEQTLADDLRRGPLGILRLTQALAKQTWRETPRLYVLTRGSQAIGDSSEPVSAIQSTVWGLGRVISTELPDIGCTRIDLSPQSRPDDDATFVTRELKFGGNEDQIAIRSDGRYVARLSRSSWHVNTFTTNDRELADGRAYRLETHQPGVLERLALYPLERRIPAEGEVEIEIEAAGLNFLDVMKAMGIYPGMDRTAIPLGHECAGRIVAIGPGVTQFHLGQAVVASVPHSLASHVTLRVEFVVSKPHNLSFEEAATIPAVYMTVCWALQHVARLQRGERILIHSASGGTGLAAIQYAQAIGAEIFATAGNDEKRAFLRSLGIKHVMDSRTTAFADEIMVITNSRGVDVVLNSLTGDALTRSFDVLAPYGRFLEIGKKDIYANTQLGLLPFRKALTYTAIDLAGMADVNPGQYGALLSEVMLKFADGTMKPAPITVFPAHEVDAAFRLMAQAKHIGKIAIRMRDANAQIVRPHKLRNRIHSDATYLITGGLGGLGLTLAQGLANQGAKHLVLVGRNEPNSDALEAIGKIESTGARVYAWRVDVAKRADVDAAIATVERDLPPLKGVVHAAGVLEDKTIAQMGESAFLRPMEPKIWGGWNLHCATRHIALDFFVLYSSAAGLLGSPGQANYAAANTFLDALCQARAAEGLPATSIQWGAFANVGLAAAQDVRGKRLAARGSASFDPEDQITLFLKIISEPRIEVSPMRFDVRQWVEFYPQIAGAPFLSELAGEKGGHSEVKNGTTFRAAIENVQPAQRSAMVEEHLADQLGKVLRIDPKRIDKRAPFATLGMDSLMSLELRNRLEASLGLKLSASLLFTYTTTNALATHLVGKLFSAVEQRDDAPVTLRAPTGEQPTTKTKSNGPVPDEDAQAEPDLVDKLEAFEEYLK